MLRAYILVAACLTLCLTDSGVASDDSSVLGVVTNSRLGHALSERGHTVGENKAVSETDSEVTFQGIFLHLAALMAAMLVYHFLQSRGIYGYPFTDETSLCLLFGLLAGWLSPASSSVTFSGTSFLTFLLPPIIFEAGYTIHRPSFFRHIFSISVFAIAGTLIATVVMSASLEVYCSFNVPCPSGKDPTDPSDFPTAVHSPAEVPKPAPKALQNRSAAVLDSWTDGTEATGEVHARLQTVEHVLFSSLSSATDPVTVLALMKALRVDDDLHALIFGEAVLNDAVAMTVFESVARFTQTTPSWDQILERVGWFVVVVLGSAVLGFGVAVIGALVSKHVALHRQSHLEVVLILIVAYSAYAVGAVLRLSAIISLFVAGIASGKYTYLNMSDEARVQASACFSIAAHVAESVV